MSATFPRARDEPLVSVVLPAYNHERYVRASIQSVIDQTHRNLELVVINDGSSDRTGEVIRSLDEACRARFTRYEFINKSNEGSAIGMNIGIRWARSEYLTSNASDDLMDPDKVSRLLVALKGTGPEVALAYGDARFIDDDGAPTALDAGGNASTSPDAQASFLAHYLRQRPDVRPAENGFDYERLLAGNYLPAMSMMWRREALLRVGLFEPGIGLDDWDMWLRLARGYRGVYVPEVLASYRWHASNTVKTGVVRLLQSQDMILMRELGLARGHHELEKHVALQVAENAMGLVAHGHWRYFSRLLQTRVMRLLHLRILALGLCKLRKRLAQRTRSASSSRA